MVKVNKQGLTTATYNGKNSY